MIHAKATPSKFGEVKLAEHGDTREGLAVQSNDPRLGGTVGWTRLYMLPTAPTAGLGIIGEFAFSKDKKGLWFKEITGWELMGLLLKEVTHNQAMVITSTGALGTIEVAT